MINQLSVNVSLLKLKQSLVPKIRALISEIKDREITPMIVISNQIIEDSESLEIDNLISLENQLLELGIEFNVEYFITELTAVVNRKVKDFCKDVEVLSAKYLNEFELNQDSLIPEQINVKRVTDYLIENEVINEVNNLLHIIVNEVKSESLKMENSIRLLQFTMTNQNEDLILLKKVKDKVQLALSDSANHLVIVSNRLEAEIEKIAIHLEEILVDDIVLNRAENLNGIIRKEKARKGYYKYVKKIGFLIEKTNNNIDKLVIKGKDLLAISSYQYRTKELQNPHSKVSSFIDSISVSEKLNKQIPFYYHQLFVGKHNAPSSVIKNRTKELSLFDNAYQNYLSGKTGAILFTGEHQSGMSYLVENILNSHKFNSIIKLEKPPLVIEDTSRLVERAFKTASGMNLSIDEIMNTIPKGSVIIIEDLELWWTRTEKGIDAIGIFNNLIQKYSHRVLFMLSCNTYFYQLIRQVVSLDANLLETIMLLPLKIEDIKSAIISRHRSGGLSYEWKGKLDKELSNRKENQMIKRIASVSEGNIGASFYIWLGNIDEIENNALIFSTINQSELPNVLTTELDNILVQVLLHKELSISRLELIYKNQNKEQLTYSLESLYRMGLIEEIGVKNYQLNPFAIVYVVKYLRRKELIN